MANIRNANTYYIDATGSLAVKGVRVWSVFLTNTAANAVVTLKDVSSGATKLTVKNPTDGTTVLHDLTNNPIVFPNGIDATTVTNCVVTLVVEDPRG
jgi:hypothetical protein